MRIGVTQERRLSCDLVLSVDCEEDWKKGRDIRSMDWGRPILLAPRAPNFANGSGGNKVDALGGEDRDRPQHPRCGSKRRGGNDHNNRLGRGALRNQHNAAAIRARDVL